MEESRGILNKVESLTMEHNFREANTLVDILANDVVSLSKLIIWKADFSEHILHLALNEITKDGAINYGVTTM